MRAFVQVTRRAFAAAVADREPAPRALFAAVSGLDDRTQRRQWERVKALMRDPTTTAVALGAFDGARMRADCGLIQTQFEGAQPFDLDEASTNAFLDTATKMAAGWGRPRRLIRPAAPPAPAPARHRRGRPGPP